MKISKEYKLSTTRRLHSLKEKKNPWDVMGIFFVIKDKVFSIIDSVYTEISTSQKSVIIKLGFLSHSSALSGATFTHCQEEREKAYFVVL